MENIKKLIQENNLISSGDVIGIGVSGGKDSMALLHYMQNLSKQLDFEIVAITIDHGIRENAKDDVNFVMEYCKNNNIRAYKFKLNVLALAKEKSLSLESAGRQARFEVFENMLKKGIVNKIALAHHQSDQAETVLMRLLRGSGISGLKGMSVVRDDKYIRPMLKTSENAIWQYICDNAIDFREDETNQESEYNRNFLRNEIFPKLLTRWPNAINAILSFADLASKDDEYISSQVPTDAFIVNDKEIKIPLSYFIYPSPIVSRMIYKALSSIGINKDIEVRHIDMITNCVQKSENGKKIDLPFKVRVYKEYDYITIINKQKAKVDFVQNFKLGTIKVSNFGEISVKKVQKMTPIGLFVDADKLPKDAKWRFKRPGDVFEKFGGGTKKLKDFLIDKKIPSRLRENLPVLASGNEVYAVAGVEISNKAKVDQNTKRIYQIC